MGSCRRPAGPDEDPRDAFQHGGWGDVQGRHNLVDEYVLLIHSLVLGSGRRLFPDGGPFAALRLLDARPTTTGVLVATYQPAEPTARETT